MGVSGGNWISGVGKMGVSISVLMGEGHSRQRRVVRQAGW